MNHKNRKFIRKHFTILKNTVTGFMNESALKYSASLAYYTVFSLGPILVLMISLAGIFLGEDAIQGKVFAELKGLVGNNVALQVQSIIKNLSLSGKSNLALIISVITLLIASTTVFGDIQNSINNIWHVRSKAQKGWLKLIKDRILSSSLVIGLGFLLVVTLIINGVVMVLTDRIQHYIAADSVQLFSFINFFITLGLIFFMFCVVFKVLPDVNIKWRTVRTGALFTAVLFVIGHFLIGLYIGSSDTEGTYGTASAIVIILLWVYYTSAILYFGAVYTREYAAYTGTPIEPASYAVYVEVREIEKEVKVVPPAPLTDEEMANGKRDCMNND